jgi:hypothetical protein
MISSTRADFASLFARSNRRPRQVMEYLQEHKESNQVVKRYLHLVLVDVERPLHSDFQDEAFVSMVVSTFAGADKTPFVDLILKT